MSENINIRYTFTLGGEQAIHEVELDAQSLECVFDPPADPPAWTALEFEKCHSCPLDSAEHPSCPLALSLHRLVEMSRRLLSYEEMDARVDMPDRTVLKRTTAQKAISSLLGLHMATSGCPNMRVLRPMARFHTPFTTRQEGIYRSASTYLLGQYFLHSRGGAADLELRGLHEAYAKIHTVNVGISRRLRHVSEGDANLNALVLLDLLAQELPSAIRERLGEIEYIFAPYFEQLPDDGDATSQAGQ